MLELDVSKVFLAVKYFCFLGLDVARLNRGPGVFIILALERILRHKGPVESCLRYQQVIKHGYIAGKSPMNGGL